MREEAFSVVVRFGGRDEAFIDDWQAESVRLLRQVAQCIELQQLLPGERMGLRDINGNTIGEAIVSR